MSATHNDNNDTVGQFDRALSLCRGVFEKKLNDYGPSWRILRPAALTDQLLIKARRIRSLEIKGNSMVGEGILPEFVAIVNYSIIGIIQLRRGFSDSKDIDNAEAMSLYDSVAVEARSLMIAKNHDYDEAWRMMRVLSYTDLILQKIQRVKEIEDNHGHTEVSEGIDANYMDMLNYAIFAIIKLAGFDR